MNLAKDALHVLGSVAPTLATAVAGPFGGMAVKAIESALGFDSAGQSATDSQKAVENALLGGDPQTLLAMKKAENDFTAQMKELGISEEKLTMDDRASARNMAIQTKDPTAARLAWLIVGGFISISAMLIALFVLYPQRAALIDAAAWTMMGTLLGYFGSEAKQVAAFYFGSSADSQAKTQTLSEIAKS